MIFGSIPTVEVVTRYGGVKHLAEATDTRGLRYRDRWYMLCRGTSAWTVESWEANPDHPLLTIEQIKALPPCSGCAEMERIS